MATNSSNGNSSASDYLDVVAFIEVGMDRKRQPRTIGYAKARDGKVYVNLQMFPAPGSGWDGSLVIEKRREREEEEPERRPAERPRNGREVRR